LSSTFNVDQFPHPNPFRTVPIAVHPAPVHKPGYLTNILVLKQRSARGCTLTYSAHFVCHHPSYAHTLGALVTTNVLTAATHISYPEGYCYVITEAVWARVRGRVAVLGKPVNRDEYMPIRDAIYLTFTNSRHDKPNSEMVCGTRPM
jgi:hypothetical protein